jgi:5'-deoxynucleotidase YfbR-like HD superfamily hydrolase
LDTSEVFQISRLALGLGGVTRGLNRIGDIPESDTDHTVMVSWLACMLAFGWYPHLDSGLIAQFALVHDAVEVYAGDTYAVGLTEEGQQDKKYREHAALKRIRSEFSSFTWLPDLIVDYEQQEIPEARFAWAIDKIVPKIMCIFDECDAVSKRVSRDERTQFRTAERLRMQERVRDFPLILELYDELCMQTSLTKYYNREKDQDPCP